MDDTIENLLDAWVQWINTVHGTNVKPEDVNDWNMELAFPTVSKEKVYEPLLTDYFWYTVSPKEDAVNVLNRILDDGHSIYIVTTSNYQTLRTKMDAVLFKYFPYLSWDNVIIAKDKYLVSGDVLIDDGVHNLLKGSYRKILMDSPHNRSYDAEKNNMTRVNDWYEIYGIIRGMSKGEDI